VNKPQIRVKCFLWVLEAFLYEKRFFICVMCCFSEGQSRKDTKAKRKVWNGKEFWAKGITEAG
jgi:hypothetical protein